MGPGKTGKAMRAVGVMPLLVGLAVGSVEPQQPIDDVTVSGRAECGTAGPVGRYTLIWTVVNPKVNGEITITSATESGAFEGEVDISPNPLTGGQRGTGSDGPVPGNTKGTVTLGVDYVTAGEVRGKSTGVIHLEGDCVN